MKNDTRMFHVYAVVNSAPIAKVTKKRMNRERAEAKVEALLSEGSPRAYAIPA